jgi:hypothetical protein
VKTTARNATTASTSKTGLFALLCGVLRIKGSRASKNSLGQAGPRLHSGQVSPDWKERPDPALFTRNNNCGSRHATSGKQERVGNHLAQLRSSSLIPRLTLTPLLILTPLILASAGLTTALPATASAYATLEAPPIFSAAPGLPDGRVYEQVSPADKNGNEAGSGTDPQITGANNHWGVAAGDGDSVLFEGTGPMGESPWGSNLFFVASKTGSAAWSTRGLTPRAQQNVGVLNARFKYVDPSADLSHVMFDSEEGEYATPPPKGDCPQPEGDLHRLFLSGPDPFAPATMLGRQGSVECAAGVPVGGSPDFSTVYFTGGGLLPADAAVEEGNSFYEDREGVLQETGVLPDGLLDQFGAVPAAAGHEKSLTGNQVSSVESPDGAPAGSRAFFVSPDPATCEQNPAYPGKNNCAVNPPELYVRENGERTLLVSQDTLLPSETGGLPSAAPAGVSQMLNPTHNIYHKENADTDGSYVFASPDGSQAFFQSTDALTPAAAQAAPGSEPKTYDFDVDTDTLTYLPDVTGQLVATDTHGTSLAFVKPEEVGEPGERGQLDLWSAGAAGGSVAPVVQLPGPPTSGGSGGNESYAVRYVSQARMSEDGSVLVFTTATQISGFNNGGTHINHIEEVEPGSEQIYRYDLAANTLGCVSCTPAGVTPSGDSSFSSMQPAETYEFYGATTAGGADARGISANGDRIFFDSRDPLVPQDTNTDSPEVECKENTPCPQGRDVYEWENGVVYLISGGKSPRNSYYLDNSANGEDVFFATTESLVPGDTDGGYDIYDARIPHPGDNPPAAAVPCEGAVCQGPPNVPSPLTPPASATFSGLGNPAPEPAATPTVTKKTTKKTVKCKKGLVKNKKGKCIKKAKPKQAKKSTRGSK